MKKVDIEKLYLNEIKNNMKHNIWNVIFEHIKENKDKYSDDGLIALYDVLDVINRYDVDKGEIENE